MPALPFLVNEDLTRADGAIVCRRVDELEVLRLGWRAIKLLKYLRVPPIPF